MTKIVKRPASPIMPSVQMRVVRYRWPLLILALVSFVISLTPTIPNDLWWHLKAGEIIAQQGIPATNLFAWTLPADAPYTYQSWLAEWLFYQLYTVGGLALVIFARNVLGTIAFGLVASDAHRRSGSWPLAAGVTLLALMMTVNQLTTRPQNWSWLLCALIAMLLRASTQGTLRACALLVVPALTVLWVNLHGAFVLALLLVGLYALGETLQHLLKRPLALSWAQLRPLYGIAVLTGAAMLVNPRGSGIVTYVLTIFDNPAITQYVVEWQPPSVQTRTGLVFFGSALLLLIGMLRAYRSLRVTDVLLVALFYGMAATSQRHIVWYGLVALPIAADAWTRRAPVRAQAAAVRGMQHRSARRSGRAPARRHPERQDARTPTMQSRPIAVLLTSVTVVLCIAAVLVQPWFKARLPLPRTYQDRFVDLPGAPQLASRDTPVAAAAHLRAAPCAGPLFNEVGAGSYLDWALYPQTQVFVDPRIEVYPFTLWQDYIAISAGRNLEHLLDQQYQIACIVLNPVNQPRLASILAQSPGWQRTFPAPGAVARERTEVWRRR